MPSPSIIAIIPQRPESLPPLRFRLAAFLELDRRISEGLAELEAQHPSRRPLESSELRRTGTS